MNVDAVAAGILACVAAGLTVPPCTACVVAGQPAIDRCCDTGDCAGQLTVHLSGLFDADATTGARTAPRPRRCRPGALAGQFVVTLARCLPTFDEHGDPYDCDVLAPAAAAFNVDVGDLWTALACCPDVSSIVGVDVQQPPTGGCIVAVATVNASLQPGPTDTP